MKNFINYLTESQKTYEFRIKIANVNLDDKIDTLESVLDAYGLDSITKPKRLPIKESDIDFPSMKNVELSLVDAVLTYPCNSDQLRAIISERANISPAQVVVVPKNHPEETWRWNEEGDSELREFEKGKSVLEEELPEATKEQKEAGKNYAEATSFLKELSKLETKIEGNETADSSSTNELPQGTESPVGSKQNKIPKVK